MKEKIKSNKRSVFISRALVENDLTEASKMTHLPKSLLTEMCLKYALSLVIEGRLLFIFDGENFIVKEKEEENL